MKYTAASCVLGLTALFFANLYFLPEKKKSFCYFALGGITGFIVTNGFFMARLWITYGNPFFPFLNRIFQSSFFDPVNFDETRFYPRTLLQQWFYPFFWIKKSDGLVTEPRIYVADARLALAYISVVVSVLSVGWVAIRRKTVWPFRWVRELVSLALFSVVSYVIWLRIYSVLRYALVLEAISGILILLFLSQWFRGRVIAVMGVLLVAFCWGSTTVPSWNRMSFGKKVIELDNFPAVEPNALIIYYEEGMAFLSMYFPPDADFIGGIKLPIHDYPQGIIQLWARQHNALPSTYYGYRFKDVTKQKISAHDGPIYIVTTPWFMMFHPITLSPYGLTRSAYPDCKNFNASIHFYSNGWQLCRVDKLVVHPILPK